MTEYKCTICGLHYGSGRLVTECRKWCSTHDRCNLSIARHSIEANKKG